MNSGGPPATVRLDPVAQPASYAVNSILSVGALALLALFSAAATPPSATLQLAGFIG